MIYIIIIIHEFHRDASLEQNFRAAEDMYIEREKIRARGQRYSIGKVGS